MAEKLQFITPKQCCLYIVDPQERLMAHIHGVEGVKKNITLMIHCAQVLDIPIIANTQYKKGIGPIVAEIAELLEGVSCPDKTEFNGLANSEVKKVVAGLPQAVDTLLLVGVETHICIYQTAAGALLGGFQPWVVADAVSSRLQINDQLGKHRLRDIGAVVAPAEMIIYELLQQAGTPAFKSMLPFLK